MSDLVEDWSTNWHSNFHHRLGIWWSDKVAQLLDGWDSFERLSKHFVWIQWNTYTAELETYSALLNTIPHIFKASNSCYNSTLGYHIWLTISSICLVQTSEVPTNCSDFILGPAGHLKYIWDDLWIWPRSRTVVHGCGSCLLTQVHWVIWWIAHVPGLFEVYIKWPWTIVQVILNWSKIDDMGITKCILLSRFLIWWSHQCTIPN